MADELPQRDLVGCCAGDDMAFIRQHFKILQRLIGAQDEEMIAHVQLFIPLRNIHMLAAADDLDHIDLHDSAPLQILKRFKHRAVAFADHIFRYIELFIQPAVRRIALLLPASGAR